MPCQVEIGMVCEVDWCGLRAGCGVVDDELVVVRQFVCDCRVDFSRETFFPIRTHARQFHFVIFYRIIPNFLRNQIQRIIHEFSCMIHIEERLVFNNYFLTETGTKRISQLSTNNKILNGSKMVSPYMQLRILK